MFCDASFRQFFDASFRQFFDTMFEHENTGHLLQLAMLFITATIALELALLVYLLDVQRVARKPRSNPNITVLLDLGEYGKPIKEHDLTGEEEYDLTETRNPSEPTKPGPGAEEGEEEGEEEYDLTETPNASEPTKPGLGAEKGEEEPDLTARPRSGPGPCPETQLQW